MESGRGSAVVVNTTLVQKTAMAGLLALIVLALAVWATKGRGSGAEYNRG